MHLRTKTPSALNNPKLWHQPLKPYFDVASYQQRIDGRVGLNKDGHSIIRLSWGQDIWQRAFNEETPRYWTRRMKVGGGYQYWRVPRWILEKRLEPEQYVDAWEASRWSMTDASGAPIDKGPPPPEYYTFAYLCAEHEGDGEDGYAACCTRAYYTNRTRCWGEYRVPSEDDFQLISRAVQVMEADKFRDPYRPLTSAELTETELAANMAVERANEEFERYEAAMVRDFNKLHGHRVFEGPNSFHDLGVGNSSGIIPVRQKLPLAVEQALAERKG